MGMITARPATRHQHPAYPTRQDVQATPNLLAEHVPPAWLSLRELAGSPSLLLATGLAGCNPGDDTKLGVGKGTPAIVAPLFVHGEGRGATGCVVTTPPVFLPEEEAIQTITEELGKHGLRFSESGVEIPDVTIPSRVLRPKEGWITGRVDWEHMESPGTGIPLNVDLLDRGNHIAIEYISNSDHAYLRNSTGWSSVTGYDMQEIAQYVSEEVSAQGTNIRLGLFYDPMERLNYHELFLRRQQDGDDQAAFTIDEAREQVWAKSRQLLRLQVQDFVDWLKAQGVI